MFVAKRVDKNYCSSACYKKAKYHEGKPKQNAKCLNCGKLFLPNKNGQKYCSLHCQKTYSNKMYKNNKRFNGMKYLVLKRDGYKCVKCGNEKGLNVHHKDNSGQSEKPNNNIDNLITLCNACHITEHETTKYMNNNDEHNVLVKCQNCGAEHNVAKSKLDDNRGKFCSNECKYEYMAQKRRTGHYNNCLTCGKEFWTTDYKEFIGKGKYCSAECSQKSQKGTHKPKPITKQITVQCLQCGEDFTTTNVRINDGRGRYCSRKCLNEAKKTMPSLKNKKHPSRVYVNCQVCGTEFHTTQSNVDRGRAKYCSRECYNTARKTS